MFRPRSRSLTALLLWTFVILARPALAGINRWTPLGPDVGTVRALVVDPEHPATIYAGTDGSGVWRSINNGGRWAPRGRGLASPDVFALAIAPEALWAATGLGIHRSTDGGATWQRVWSDSDGDPRVSSWVQSIAVAPTDPDVVWAGTLRGWILKTTDGGATWVRSFETVGPVESIAIDPTDPDKVYAGSFRTTDGGATWQAMDSHGRLIVLDPADPRTLYSGGSGVWKSTDSGVTWTQLSSIGLGIESLFIDPFDPEVLLAGVLGSGLFRSDDGGRTWNKVESLPVFRVIALAADPVRPGRIWLGSSDLAVFRSLDHGRTWHARRQGLSAAHTLAADFDKVQTDTLYAAAEGHAFRTTDAGRTWNRIDAALTSSPGIFDVSTIATHPRYPGLLFAGTGGGAYRSLDRGSHWTRVINDGEIRSFASDPRRKYIHYAAGENFYRSVDAGATWTQLALPTSPDDSKVAKIVVAPHFPAAVFVLNFNPRFNEATTLLRSSDHGTTWTEVFDRVPADVAPDPVTPGLLYLAESFHGEIWRSLDDGQTWEMIAEGAGGGAQLTSLLVERQDPSILYLGTYGTGVWRSTDRGVTWAPLAAGMIAPRITCLKEDPRSPRRLIACTWGGGLLEIRLPSSS
jgi:photosystem II stability/assembly factor-like uncharacterized protein